MAIQSTYFMKKFIPLPGIPEETDYPVSPPMNPEKMLASTLPEPSSQYRASVKCMNHIIHTILPKSKEEAHRLFKESDKVLLPQHAEKIAFALGLKV